jgi:peptide/nickel transport system substrate-binding protein
VRLPRCRTVPAALLLLAMNACSPHDVPARDVKGGDGVLRVSLGGEPKTLNPNLSPFDELALLVTQNIFSRLVTRTDDGKVLPELAERWTQAPDGLSYTFSLRRGVTFHDGRPLTSEDVRSTFARMSESTNSELAQRLAGVDTPDPQTVTIRLKAPWAAFIPSIAWYGASILPAHIYGATAWKDSPANRKPIGSGPFTLRSWDPGRRIVLEKNPAFFGQGPYIDAIEYVITDSSSAGVQLLLDGRVDFVLGRPPSDLLPRLTRTPGIRVSTAPSDGRTYLAFNLRHAPFDDLRLRRAVNLAIDRLALVERVLSGLGTPAVGFYTPAVGWAYNANARVPAYDRAAARQVVAAVAPPPIRFVYPGSPNAAPSTLGAEVMHQLEAVGLRIHPRTIPPADLLPYLFGGGDYDMVILSGAHGPDPDMLTARFGSSGSMQVMGYANADLDRVLARGGSVSDPVQRAAAYFRAQEILAQDLPIAPLYETIRASVFRDGLRGLPQEDARGLVADYTFNLVRLPRR